MYIEEKKLTLLLSSEIWLISSKPQPVVLMMQVKNQTAGEKRGWNVKDFQTHFQTMLQKPFYPGYSANEMNDSIFFQEAICRVMYRRSL